MNQPITITLAQIDEINTRDSIKERKLSEEHDKSVTGLTSTITTLMSQVEALQAEADDYETYSQELDLELQFATSENNDLNELLATMSRDMDVLVSDFDCISNQDLDVAASWAQDAYDLMRGMTSDIPIWDPTQGYESYVSYDYHGSDRYDYDDSKDYDNYADTQYDGITEYEDSLTVSEAS